MDLDGSGRLVKKEPLSVPDGTQFYTVVFEDLDGDGTMETLSLGKLDVRYRGHLVVSSITGEILSKSAETYGGTNNTVNHG